jgi:hypothetical protein
MVPTTAAVIAILAICALLSVYAQRQQPDNVKLKAEAKSAFDIISSDKLTAIRGADGGGSI